jgi:hypothetical protein
MPPKKAKNVCAALTKALADASAKASADASEPAAAATALPSEVVELVLGCPHALTIPPTELRSSPIMALLGAMRRRGHAALAAQYVMRYPGELAERLPLHVLVSDMVACGDFDSCLRLCANRKVAEPPHSLHEHHSEPDLLLAALSEWPRFVFVGGRPSAQRMSLGAHLGLLARWIGGADNFVPLLQAVVGALLLPPPTAVGQHDHDGAKSSGGGPSLENLAAAIELQLSTVGPAAARRALPAAQQVEVLLGSLAEADAFRALRLLRKHGVAGRGGVPGGKRAAPLRAPCGAVLLGTAVAAAPSLMEQKGWSWDDFGELTPRAIIERCLHQTPAPLVADHEGGAAAGGAGAGAGASLAVDHLGRGGSGRPALHVAERLVDDICAFELRRECAEVLRALL